MPHRFSIFSRRRSLRILGTCSYLNRSLHMVGVQEVLREVWRPKAERKASRKEIQLVSALEVVRLGTKTSKKGIHPFGDQKAGDQVCKPIEGPCDCVTVPCSSVQFSAFQHLSISLNIVHYLCIYTYVSRSVCLCVCMDAWMHACKHVCMYVCRYVWWNKMQLRREDTSIMSITSYSPLLHCDWTCSYALISGSRGESFYGLGTN